MSDTLTREVHALMQRVAESVVLPRYQSLAAHEIVEKKPGDLVTIADRESEAMLAEGLARILPEAAIVGEEAMHADPTLMERLGDTLCWIVDPIDGTRNFAAGRPPFGLMIALAEKGETRAGWIYDPLQQRLCHAALGGGAFVDGERVAARESGETPPVAAISMIFMDEMQRHRMKTAIAPHYRLTDIPYCAAEQYPRLALGVNDVSIFERTLAWDHAAGALWLNEAGGQCARFDGSPYRVDEWERKGMIAASSPALWDGLARRLEP
ncbi:inositol monophosphatase family protein [Croceicoccus naphthovorans]|uniref:Inositol monophosphatase n=1 Tax=Croceicoccus naphthovorans TaxID=1348774 RepID=A0A0G3XGG5_9SPHN|nr:inositol monophosphatase family protein [Croceicoccus naphthovorans]AKM09699.1 inositol monophosphatase [Croceicoccus naphthovorans]MBB3990834.1 fructose-1,6-bisphosphatase/inositol monophosphatase family enzyme [Croceicoccus naphthovorans]